MSESRFNRKNALKAGLLGGLGAVSIYAANQSHAGKVFHGPDTYAGAALEHNLQQKSPEVGTEALTDFFFDRLTTNGLNWKHSRLELTKVAKLQALVAKEYVESLVELEDIRANPAMARRLATIERELLGAEILAQHTDNFFGEENRRVAEHTKETLYQASLDQEDPWLAPEPDVALLDLDPVRINLAPELVGQYATPDTQTVVEAKTTPAQATEEKSVATEAETVETESTPENKSNFPFVPMTLATGALGLGYFAWKKSKNAVQNTVSSARDRFRAQRQKTIDFRDELAAFRAKQETAKQAHPGLSFPKLSEQALKFPTFQAWAERLPSLGNPLERLRQIKMPTLPSLDAQIEITIPGPKDIYRAVTTRLPKFTRPRNTPTQEQLAEWSYQYTVLRKYVETVRQLDPNGNYAREAQARLLEVYKALDEKRPDTIQILEKNSRHISIILSALQNPTQA